MVSYSVNFRFIQPATAELLWGDSTNTNIGTLLEEAIGGYISIAMSDANTTLTATNGASDQARNHNIRFTGTLTAGRNIVVPTNEQVWIIDNSTTGGFALTVKTTAGTGIAVPAGKKMMVFSDGTNVVDSITNLPAGTTINNTTVILSGGALGTPSSGTLTNCTGLPIAGLTASTSTAIGVGSVELGHASDTTLTRVSAGVVAVEGVNLLLNGGALGTPSSGTLTNCTGLPVAGITASTATALGVGSIELGHATDTTIARVSAGVVSVEGNTVAMLGATQTFTGAKTFSSVLTVSTTGSGGISVTSGSGGNHGIYGYANNTTGYSIYGEAPGGTSYGGVIGWANGTTKYGILGFSNTHSVYANSDIYCGGSYLPSDERLKENITALSDPREMLLAVEWVEYDWRLDAEGRPGEHDFGIIAQREIDRLPAGFISPVTAPNTRKKDQTEEDYEKGKSRNQKIGSFWSANYTKFIPFFGRMLQLQQKQIDDLTVRLEKLGG